MIATEILVHNTGYLVLTADGRLGSYRSDKQFVVDTELSQALASHISKFLADYRRKPKADGWCLGIAHGFDNGQPWGTPTVLFTESVIRDLYPTSGPTPKELTAFQKKKRENSMYRAMEFLIEFRREIDRAVPVFCPVLFDRGTTFGDYPHLIDEPIPESESRLPVIEVLNLLAPLPGTSRNSPEFHALMQRLYRDTVSKGLRTSDPLMLLGDVAIRGPSNLGAQQSPGPFERVLRSAPYGSAARALAPAPMAYNVPSTLSSSRSSVVTAFAALEELHKTDSISSIELLRGPCSVPVDTKALQNFAVFQDLQPGDLDLVAQWNVPYKAAGGTQLIARDQRDHWNFFLLEGQLSLVAADGASIIVDSSSRKASYPIASLKPRKYTVTAVTLVRFLWIHDNWLKALDR